MSIPRTLSVVAGSTVLSDTRRTRFNPTRASRTDGPVFITLTSFLYSFHFMLSWRHFSTHHHAVRATDHCVFALEGLHLSFQPITQLLSLHRAASVDPNRVMNNETHTSTLLASPSQERLAAIARNSQLRSINLSAVIGPLSPHSALAISKSRCSPGIG